MLGIAELAREEILSPEAVLAQWARPQSWEKPVNIAKTGRQDRFMPLSIPIVCWSIGLNSRAIFSRLRARLHNRPEIRRYTADTGHRLSRRLKNNARL